MYVWIGVHTKIRSCLLDALKFVVITKCNLGATLLRSWSIRSHVISSFDCVRIHVFISLKVTQKEQSRIPKLEYFSYQIWRLTWHVHGNCEFMRLTQTTSINRLLIRRNRKTHEANFLTLLLIAPRASFSKQNWTHITLCCCQCWSDSDK